MSHLDVGNNSINKSLDSQCGSTVDLSGINLHWTPEWFCYRIFPIFHFSYWQVSDRVLCFFFFFMVWRNVFLSTSATFSLSTLISYKMPGMRQCIRYLEMSKTQILPSDCLQPSLSSSWFWALPKPGLCAKDTYLFLVHSCLLSLEKPHFLQPHV